MTREGLTQSLQLRPDCPQLAGLGWTQSGRQWPSFQTRVPIFSRPGHTRFSGEGCVLGSRRAWPGTTPAWLCSFDLHSWTAVSSKDTSLPLWNLPVWPFISSEGWSSPFSSCLGQETHTVPGLGRTLNISPNQKGSGACSGADGVHLPGLVLFQMRLATRDLRKALRAAARQYQAPLGDFSEGPRHLSYLLNYSLELYEIAIFL